MKWSDFDFCHLKTIYCNERQFLYNGEGGRKMYAYILHSKPNVYSFIKSKLQYPKKILKNPFSSHVIANDEQTDEQTRIKIQSNRLFDKLDTAIVSA